MALFNFFNVPKHRTFNYQPRYYDPKKEVYYKMEIFGSECDTSFTYTFTNSKIDIKDTKPCK